MFAENVKNTLAISDIKYRVVVVKTNQEPIGKTIKRRKCKFIGHTLKKDEGGITNQNLDYQSTGKIKIGRPAETWKRNIVSEAEEAKKNWRETKPLAQNTEE